MVWGMGNSSRKLRRRRAEAEVVETKSLHSSTTTSRQRFQQTRSRDEDEFVDRQVVRQCDAEEEKGDVLTAGVYLLGAALAGVAAYYYTNKAAKDEAKAEEELAVAAGLDRLAASRSTVSDGITVSALGLGSITVGRTIQREQQFHDPVVANPDARAHNVAANASRQYDAIEANTQQRLSSAHSSKEHLYHDGRADADDDAADAAKAARKAAKAAAKAAKAEAAAQAAKAAADAAKATADAAKAAADAEKAAADAAAGWFSSTTLLILLILLVLIRDLFFSLM
ncbi:hypothetical protein DFH09DRAFT_1359125 [Mycena vulgaris]|nr:hypothetical protein DFH09DRAFT_1359125 [Mycena vulgaris]